MKWLNGTSGPILAIQDEDLVRAGPLFVRAAELWLRDATSRDHTGGTVVIGAGIGVMYLGPRKRQPVGKIVIPCPFQSDGGGSVRVPLRYLAYHGIAAFHVAGRMD